MRIGRFFRRSSRAAVVLTVVFAFCCAAVAAYGLVDSDMAADIAVVPGNKVYSDGRVHKRLAARLDAAAVLYREKRCGKIVASGGIDASGNNEAVAMGRYLEGQGVPREDIVLDPDGRNTWETARFVSAYMRENGHGSVLVASQHFHVARCEMALRFMGVEQTGSVSPSFFEKRDFRSTAREVAALVAYFFRGVATRLA